MVGTLSNIGVSVAMLDYGIVWELPEKRLRIQILAVYTFNSIFVKQTTIIPQFHVKIISSKNETLFEQDIALDKLQIQQGQTMPVVHDIYTNYIPPPEHYDLDVGIDMVITTIYKPLFGLILQYKHTAHVVHGTKIPFRRSSQTNIAPTIPGPVT